MSWWPLRLGALFSFFRISAVRWLLFLCILAFWMLLLWLWMLLLCLARWRVVTKERLHERVEIWIFVVGSCWLLLCSCWVLRCVVVL